jgi:hypothetical protein
MPLKLERKGRRRKTNRACKNITEYIIFNPGSKA